MNSKYIAFTLTLGSACALSLAVLPVAQAADNPFAMKALKSGYLLADATDAKEMNKKMDEHICDEAKQGAQANEEKCKENKLGANTDTKFPEGWCGDGGRCGYKRR